MTTVVRQGGVIMRGRVGNCLTGHEPPNTGFDGGSQCLAGESGDYDYAAGPAGVLVGDGIAGKRRERRRVARQAGDSVPALRKGPGVLGEDKVVRGESVLDYLRALEHREPVAAVNEGEGVPDDAIRDCSSQSPLYRSAFKRH